MLSFFEILTFGLGIVIFSFLRKLIDLYETNLSLQTIATLMEHITRIRPRVVKLAISSDTKSLRQLKKAVQKGTPLDKGQLYFCTDMEEAKTWLVQ